MSVFPDHYNMNIFKARMNKAVPGKPRFPLGAMVIKRNPESTISFQLTFVPGTSTSIIQTTIIRQ